MKHCYGLLPFFGALACASSHASAPPAPLDAAVPYSCDLHAGSAPHFVDATAAWGLGAGGLGVTGNRIVSADLDGDGYPDLIIHPLATNQRETLGTPPKLVWALMNRPNPAGGRMFVDATVASGLFQVRGGSTTQLASSQIASLADIDNDGDLDVFMGTYVDPTSPQTDTGDRSEILLNDGKGTFTLAPISAPHPAASDRWPTTAATFTDVDRDGKIDLFVAFWYAYYGETEDGVQARLYRGAGDGTFADVTGPAHLTATPNALAQGTNPRPAYGVTSCDLDGDGAPELLVSAYGRQWNQLFQNDGTGAFTEVGRASGFAGDADVTYSDNQFFACYCTLHATDANCQGVAKPLVVCPTPADADWTPGVDDQPWRLNGNTFSTFCGDLDGDGVPDLYSAEIRHWWAGQSSDASELLHATSTPGHISFARPGNAATGLAIPHVDPVSWDEGELMVAGGDLDGDGREDLIVASSDYPGQFGLVYHQKPDHTFEEVGAAWGMHHPCVSGLTIGDFDRDGDLDVVVGSGTARDCGKIWTTNEVHLYENKGTPASWLAMRLVGDGMTANRAGIGARVTIQAGGETMVRELDGGYGHMAMGNDVGVLMVGLGGCAQVDSIQVRWPDASGTTDTWNNVAANRVIELEQGNPVVVPVSLN